MFSRWGLLLLITCLIALSPSLGLAARSKFFGRPVDRMEVWVHAGHVDKSTANVTILDHKPGGGYHYRQSGIGQILTPHPPECRDLVKVNQEFALDLRQNEWNRDQQ